MHDKVVAAPVVSIWYVRVTVGDRQMRNVVNENIEILRARAERYRRLSNDLFDPRTSEEALSLAQELDAEIARLQTEPQPAVTAAHCH